MTPKDKFDKLVREEVRELLQRHVFFMREVVALIYQNSHLKKRLAAHNKKLQRLTVKVRKLKTLLSIKKGKS